MWGKLGWLEHLLVDSAGVLGLQAASSGGHEVAYIDAEDVFQYLLLQHFALML